MRCTCGHINPDENRYCGMCGAPLLVKPVEPSYVGSEESPRGSAEHTQRVSQTIPPAVAEATRFSEYPAHSKWNGREGEPEEPEPPPRNGRQTTVSGPSFLGLSGGEEPSSSSGYSYLFQDEPERSHAGWYVLLFLLIIGGAVLYWKWQPIRDYVVSTAIAHSQKPKPPAQEQAVTPTEDAGHTPAPPVDVASNPPKAEEKTAPSASGTENKAADAGSASANTDVPSTASKPGTTPDTTAKAAKDTTATPAENANKSAASSENPPAKPKDKEDAGGSRRKAKAASSKPAPPPAEAIPGAELVRAGERFLYGRGVPKNCGQAVTYFRAAAGQSNPQAFSQLGALYATGECVPLDKAQAYTWFSRALAAQHNSNPYIERNLTMLWRDMTPQERQRVAGRSY